MTRTTGRSRLLAASLLAVSLVAASCGDDDEDAASTTASVSTTAAGSQATTATTATGAPSASASTSAAGSTSAPGSTSASTSAQGPAAAPTGTPIKIGIIYSETGRSALSYGTSDSAGTAWEEWVNTEMGGVNGHPVEVVPADGLSTGEGAAAAARELVERDGVVGVIIQDATAENAVSEYLSSAGIPMIGSSNTARPPDSGTTHWPNSYFVLSSSAPASSAASLLAAKAAGLGTFAAAVCSEVPACAENGRLYEATAPAVGVEYLGLVTVGAADPSYTAPCLELISLGSDVIHLTIAPTTALAMVDECRAQGYEGTFSAAGPTVVAEDFEAIEDLNFIGVITAFPWWADAEPVQQFRSAMEEYGDGTDVRNPAATSTWAALELFRAGMTDYGPAADAEVTGQTVIDAYHQIKGETLDGLLAAPLTFVTDGFQPLVPCFWLFSLTDGEFVTTTLGASGNGMSGALQSSCFTG